MRAQPGDLLHKHSNIVGRKDEIAEIIEVMGEDGQPPYRVHYPDGHETVITPGPDAVVEHPEEQQPHHTPW
ncbi:DUF1918 domain-containing protein [Nonomuraea sp. SYSU D8015]|uniref:DUF1918 domain-containing protein n=1 Tax=Nonomuraea sp. SYSU D8015 TaxID=2593644 RepID=UPI0016615F75|nr:DUF1918 domain-containing protein [Nonomuraea sp. SYSU D8015]